MRIIAVIFWAGTLFLLIAAGGQLLHACGSILPFANFCAGTAAEPEAELLAEQRRLRAEEALWRGRISLAPGCRIAAAAPEPSPAPDPPAEPERRAQADSAECPVRTEETLVLVDVSNSMGFDFAEAPQLAELRRQLARASNIFEQMALSIQIEALADRSTPGALSRMDVARDALRGLAPLTEGRGRLSMLSFAECHLPPRFEGSFGDGDRAAYERSIAGLALRPYSALAAAIDAIPRQTDAGRSADRPINIVIVSDGEDNCGGDPCAAARRLRAAMPHARVSVVSIADGVEANACIAEQARGTFHPSGSTEEIVAAIRRSVGLAGADECAFAVDAGR